ncbi:MAG: hypothetical protein NW237_13655 [Cyanobacteriota bacterium]|nr:hypothetical protein [Cyanobacteriota bacterium]
MSPHKPPDAIGFLPASKRDPHLNPHKASQDQGERPLSERNFTTLDIS